MEKRVFQVIDEMNQEDSNKKTQMVCVGTSLISADKVSGGCKISVGMPEQILYDIMSEKRVVILLAIDKKEYFNRIKGL